MGGGKSEEEVAGSVGAIGWRVQRGRRGERRSMARTDICMWRAEPVDMVLYSALDNPIVLLGHNVAGSQPHSERAPA